MPKYDRKPHRPDNGPHPSERLALELKALMAERRGEPAPRRVDDGRWPDVTIASYWKGVGQGHVKLHAKTPAVKVNFGHTHWTCKACGQFPGPECVHAQALEKSEALKEAKRVRGQA